MLRFRVEALDWLSRSKELATEEGKMAKLTRHEKAQMRTINTMVRAIREDRATSYSATMSRPDDDRLPFGATLTIIVDGRKLSAWCSTNLHILENRDGGPVACPVLREAIAQAID